LLFVICFFGFPILKAFKHNLMTRVYKLSELNFRPTPKGFEGIMKLGLGTQLKEKASLSVQAVIVDPSGCEGPRSVTKVPGK